MEARDLKAFANDLEAVMGLYGKTLTPTVLEAWWKALKHMALPAVIKALELHTQNPDAGQYPPKPAHVIRLLGGTSKDRVNIAWAKVEKAITSVGVWNDVVFDDALIHMVIDQMGGWAKLCETKSKDLSYRAKEFESKYQTVLFNPAQSYPKKLSGMASVHNASRGMDVSPPMTIGCVEQCRRVYKGGSSHVQIGMMTLDEANDTRLLSANQ
ncbi:DUF6475 domain-containing protein [Grimontia kaedaensis]|uniref:DUF6475 domain-containing protein n=1 Tax=Grimontia kaedaensis TaxID=2872157 RepID=A0ABY4WXF8_9GAMM|nr:DUF6475 domain-containing protein [Grimontia kaedaensis]USH03677.1 DUF6475 domain-containing protein [Grimontia kaedaensis]